MLGMLCRDARAAETIYPREVKAVYNMSWSKVIRVG